MNGRLVSSIGPGILALVGVCQDDTPEQIETLVRRILGIRLWPDGTAITDGALHYTDEGKPWRMNVTELGGEVLCGTFDGAYFSLAIYPVRQDERYEA